MPAACNPPSPESNPDLSTTVRSRGLAVMIDELARLILGWVELTLEDEVIEEAISLRLLQESENDTHRGQGVEQEPDNGFEP